MTYHLPIFLIWLVFQASISFELGKFVSGLHSTPFLSSSAGVHPQCTNLCLKGDGTALRAGRSHAQPVNCPGSIAADALNCVAPTHLRIVTYLWAGLMFTYLITFSFYQIRARIRLRRLSYQQFRTGNVLQRLQVCWVLCNRWPAADFYPAAHL